MTREEAYEILKTGICLICAHGCKNMDDCDISYCGFRDAVKTVMEESCEDAISREDALMCMTGEFLPFMLYKPEDIISKRIQRIKALPSVRPKQIECEDAISRAEALKAINKMDIPEDMSVFEIKSHIGVEIGTLPPVQPKILACGEGELDVPDTNVGDTISRQAAQEGLNHLMDSDGFRDSVGYVQKSLVRKMLVNLPPVTPRSLNPEADREESKAYCAECDHIEMCSWYPRDGCEWLKTDRYNAGYNAAKREIALSGEYERAYERGKADAHPDINDGKMSEIPTDSDSQESGEQK